MPLVNTDDYRTFDWLQFVRVAAKSDNLAACNRGILEIAQQICDMDAEGNDDVSRASFVVCSELNEISIALLSSKLSCHEALLILEARLDGFIADSLAPWISNKYGDSCIIHFDFKSMGKS